MNILVVDDNPALAAAVRRYLCRHDFHVATAPSLEAARAHLLAEPVDALSLDIRLGGEADDMSGLQLLREFPTTPAIVLTGVEGREAIIAAYRAGADDVFLKPAHMDRVAAALRLAALRRRDESPVSESAEPLQRILGVSAAIARLRSDLACFARRDAPVLITGAVGVGKDLVAEVVHALSERKGPYVAINVAAMPETLFSTELFGHVRGAFTGATHANDGAFALAKHGTILLDEIGDLAPACQTQLLRVLEARKVRRVGDAREVPLEARVVCATNVNLRERVALGAFRLDLFSRLDVMRLQVPSLDSRREDIPLLASHFARLHGMPVAEDALAALCARSYPGNVRELRNVVERAAARTFAKGEPIRAAHLRVDEDDHPLSRATGRAPSLPVSEGGPAGLREQVRAFEAETARRALEQCNGNKSEAARVLGAERRWIARVLKREKKT